MKDIDFSQCNTIVRIEEGTLLSQATFDEMLRAHNDADFLRLMERTSYAHDYEAGGTTAVLNALEKAPGQLTRWALGISPSRELVMLFALRQSYHNLKALSKASILHVDTRAMIHADGLYDVDTLARAVESRHSKALPPIMARAIADVMDRADQHGDVQQVDAVYDRYMLRQMRGIADELGDDTICDFVCYYADMYNISVLLRANRQRRSPSFMQSILSSAGAVNKKVWLAQYDRSADALSTNLLASRYAELLRAAVDAESGRISAARFERIKDNAYCAQLEGAKLTAFGPLPLLAYLYAKDSEWANLRMILKARRSGIDAAAVEERMRNSYAS